MRGKDPYTETAPSKTTPSLAARLCYDFTLLYIKACTYTRYGLVAYCWPFSSHNCHTREISVNRSN